MPDRTSADWPAQLERGIAERALPGEERSGDHAVFVTRSDGALVAAIDGLGHGGEAADAAEHRRRRDRAASRRGARGAARSAATSSCATRAAWS